MQTNKNILVVLVTILLSGWKAEAQQAEQFFPAKNLITTGIYYYPEHWNENQWERDIKKIADMGFEFVHLAEFACVKM